MFNKECICWCMDFVDIKTHGMTIKKYNILLNITAFWDVLRCSSVEGRNISKQTRESTFKIEESCLP